MRNQACNWSRLLACIIVAMFISTAWAETGLGRHKQLYAVPAPVQVVIDGKLNDWDLSGQIEMFVVSETKDMQSARFALMYDQQALYLGAVVRDTTPMMNRQDPAVNGARGWDADSCQFRITLDPSQDYPVKENAFTYRATPKPEDKRDDIKHLTLWYFTDRDEPCLHLQMGMSYRLPRPEWAPFGMVPANLFQGKYVKAADGRGYTFEYRIPWSTLDAKAPLKGGDRVACTVQFNWGRADGLQTAGGSAWAYDVMATSGFAFQSADCWGRLTFSETGNVSKELVEAGVPMEKPNPLKFAYDLPEDGQVTLQLVDENKLVRRILVAQADRQKGRNVEMWDGMDDQGKPLPAGTYTVKGIIHQPIREQFVLSAHNSGVPPYPTDDNKGGWGGDHGDPTACSALYNGMLLAWDGCEYGWGIIRVDLNGKKLWGSKNCAVLLANDGKRLFTYEPGGFHATEGIRVFDIADCRPLNFGNGNPFLVPPPGGDNASNAIAGLAYTAGHVYVSYGKRNLIGVYDGVSGNLTATWQVSAPGSLAALPDGSLAAISNGQLVKLVDGKVTVLNTTELDEPSGIAGATDGTIYISNRGARQDVAVFNAQGKFLRRIGKAGGRLAVGTYDAHGMYKPAGLALDTNNRLWVAEQADGPKRISVWNTTDGTFLREFFGGSSYFGYAFINPDVPDEIYCHNVLWRIDWDKKTTTPISTIWRKTAPDMIAEPDPSAYPLGFRSLTATNGRQYAIAMTGDDRKTVLYRREGDVFKPFMASFVINHGPKQLLGSAELDDPKNTPNGWYLWQDANDDQRVQLPELYRFPDRNARYNLKALAPDMTVWTDGGYRLKPVRWMKIDQPVYDPAQIEKTFLTGTKNASGYLWLDSDGSIYTYTANQRPSLAKWSATGELQWGFPSIVDWHNALGLPVVKAGRLHGMTGPLGMAGDFTGNMSYFGVCHIFNRDGVYTAAVMRDGRTGGAGADLGQPEGQGGQLVRLVTKPGTAPRTFVLAGGQDGRVTEVFGLDTVKPLTERTFTLTPDEAKLAADALAAYQAQNGSNRLVIANGRAALENASAVSKSIDGGRSFSARAARDTQNLYVSFKVTAPNELINAMAEPRLLFKGGNCLDIQLATDANADPQRKTPAPGDVRLLVTRQRAADGKSVKPVAVLYRPKVKGFTGEPFVLTSPTGNESFDEITVVDNVGLEYKKTTEGFQAVVTIPLSLLAMSLQPGQQVKMDLGYIYGNATGSQVAVRSYWTNNSFTANIVNDIPHESRLEPANWGMATVEK